MKNLLKSLILSLSTLVGLQLADGQAVPIAHTLFTTNADPVKGIGASDTQVGAGYNAAATGNGTAIGSFASAQTNSVSVGQGSSAYNGAVSIGRLATSLTTAPNNNVMIGYFNALANLNTNVVNIGGAMGLFSYPENSFLWNGIPLFTTTGPTGTVSLAANVVNNNAYNDFGLKWQKTTTNFVSPFTSPEWAWNFLTSVSFRTNVYYIGESGTGAGFGLNMADDVPNGTTNITVSISVHSLTGSAGAVTFQWVRSATWGSYFATNLAIPTGWTNYVISFPTNADTWDAGIALRDPTIVYAISNNLTLTYSPTPTNVVLANPFTRYCVGPNDVLGNAGSVMTTSEEYNANLIAGAYDVANGFSSRSFIEFETDATNVVASVRCPGGQLNRFSIEYNGSFVSTNMAVLNGNHITGLMYLPVQPNTNGGYATVRIFNAYQSMPFGPNVVRAIYFPQGSHFKMLSTHEPKSTTVVLSDSIDCSGNVTTGGFENDMWRSLENFIPTRVVNLASSGSSLYQTWSQSVGGGAGSTSKRRQVVCKAVAEADPDNILIAFNSNDWVNNYYGDTTNGFSIDLNNMVNVFHGICPKARIMVRSPLFNTGQSGTGTLSAYGDAEAAVAAANSDFCTFLDARSWLAAGDLADGIHPTEPGAVKLAWKYILALWTNNAVVTGSSKDSLLRLPFTSFTSRATAPAWQYIGVTNQIFEWYSNSTPPSKYLSYYNVSTNLITQVGATAAGLFTSTTNTLIFSSVSALTNTLGYDATASLSAGTSVIIQDRNGNTIDTVGTVATLHVVIPLRANMRITGTAISCVVY